MERGIKKIYLEPSFCQCLSWVLVQLPRAELVKIDSPAFPPPIAKGVASPCIQFQPQKNLLLNITLRHVDENISFDLRLYKEI